MFFFNPLERCTIDDILGHPWMQGPILNPDTLRRVMGRRRERLLRSRGEAEGHVRPESPGLSLSPRISFEEVDVVGVGVEDGGELQSGEDRVRDLLDGTPFSPREREGKATPTDPPLPLPVPLTLIRPESVPPPPVPWCPSRTPPLPLLTTPHSDPDDFTHVPPSPSQFGSSPVAIFGLTLLSPRSVDLNYLARDLKCTNTNEPALERDTDTRSQCQSQNKEDEDENGLTQEKKSGGLCDGGLTDVSVPFFDPLCVPLDPNTDELTMGKGVMTVREGKRHRAGFEVEGDGEGSEQAAVG